MSPPSLSPFELRDGALFVEDVALSDLAADLGGLPGAWVISRRAVQSVLAACGATHSVPVHALGPPALLTLAAEAGCWASVRSAHELSLAVTAGFGPGRLVVRGAVKEDGLLRDALAAGVAVLETDAAEQPVLARIAGALGHKLPAQQGAPPDVEPGAFAHCGGLLACVLREPPELAVDAEWCAPAAPAERAPTLFALVDPAAAARPVTLRGLSTATGSPVAWPAQLHGAPHRGDWVLLPDPRAATPHFAQGWGQGPHPELPRMLVTGPAWRPLDRRPAPAPLEP